MKTCASLNHRKNMKAEPCRLIPGKLTGTPELFIKDLWSFVVVEVIFIRCA